MKTSIIFLGVFTAGVLTGMHFDRQSWLWGFTTCVSLVNLALPLVKNWLNEKPR